MYNVYGGMYHQYGNAGTFSMRTKVYWERSFFQRLTSIFKIDGLPDRWDYDAFKYCLFGLGYTTGFHSRKYGVVFQPSTPSGYGINYQPTEMNISSPFFNFTRGLRIGTECEVLKLTPDFRGAWDIISKYAEEMYYNEVAYRLSQINARFAYLLAASNDKDARSIKTMIEKLENAEPAIVYDAKLSKDIATGEPKSPWMQIDRDLKKNFILPELMTARREIIADFYRELGIRYVPDKKERMIESEVDQYNLEDFSRILVWYDCIRHTLPKFNAFLDTNITIEIAERGTGDESSKMDTTTEPS